MFSAKDLFFTRTSGGYTVNNSLRFRSSVSAYLSRTFGTPTNNKIFTWSAWVKIGTIPAAREGLFVAGNAGGTLYFGLEFNSSAQLNLYDTNVGGATIAFTTTQVFRDPSSWYHIVLAVDTTQAAPSNRNKLYINGAQVTTFSTPVYSPLNSSPYMNSAVSHSIGAWQPTSSTLNFDGYLAEVNFIDGQALTPSSFGQTDATTGVWQPKACTVSDYGKNGFYLPFNTTTSAATLCYDKAPIATNHSAANDWTPNNISVTTGVTYDAMVDSPTNSAAASNYCVLNPLRPTGSGGFSNGNLTGTSETGTSRGLCGTIVLDRSSKWYAEVVFASHVNNWCGVTANAFLATDINTAGQQSVLYYASNGNKYVNGTSSAYGASYTTETIGIAFDGPAGQITFYKSNVSQGAITLPSSTVDYVFVQGNAAGVAIAANWNFGQRPFTYTPPSGFVALNTQNLPTPTIAAGSAHMNVALDTGANIKTTSQALYTYYLEWIKDRANANNHQLADTVRGNTAILQSNTTAAETTYTAPTGNSVGWVWNAGAASASNTSGSITSTVSANVSAGFSVVTYTGTGANATVGHGLGVAPSMVIVKCRSAAGSDWLTWHTAIAGTDYLLLDTTGAKGTSASVWNSTVPTSSVFSVGTNADTNGSTRTFVAYCFAPVDGYSAFGKYTGNGSTDGPFVFTGFRPRWIMIKCSSAVANWYVFDTSRDLYNVEQSALYPNLANAEATSSSYYIDGLSNGFKQRNAFSELNASGSTYIYAAFAENPFSIARAR